MSATTFSPRHSLICSDLCFGAIEGIYQTRSIPETVLGLLGRFLGYRLLSDHQRNLLLGMPTTVLKDVCKSVRSGVTEKRVQRFSWIASLMGVGVSTAVAYMSCRLLPFSFTRGIICGAHSYAVGVLIFPNMETVRLISLRSFFALWIRPPELKSITEKIDREMEVFTTLAFFITSVGLTLLKNHPVLATTAGFVVATIVKEVALRVLFLKSKNFHDECLNAQKNSPSLEQKSLSEEKCSEELRNLLAQRLFDPKLQKQITGSRRTMGESVQESCLSDADYQLLSGIPVGGSLGLFPLGVERRRDTP